jgi:hypothetical protein
MDTFLEPTISWTIRMADTCVRKIDMPCSQGPSVSVCR